MSLLLVGVLVARVLLSCHPTNERGMYQGEHEKEAGKNPGSELMCSFREKPEQTQLQFFVCECVDAHIHVCCVH